MKPVVLTILFVNILSGCALSKAEQQQPAGTSPASVEGTQTFVFECPGDFTVVASVEPGKAWLFLAGRTLDLPRVESTSGTKYTGNGHSLHITGNQAAIETDKGRYVGCRNNRARAIWEHAKLNGVDFRATGNEPGWYMEISNTTDILLVADYGQHRHRFSSASVDTDPHRRTTVYNARNNDHLVKIEISAKPCRDSMSGESYPATVSIRLDDSRLTGCGKALH